MKADNQILIDSKSFAIRIIRLYKYLSDMQKEFVLETKYISQEQYDSMSDDLGRITGTLVKIVNTTKQNNV